MKTKILLLTTLLISLSPIAHTAAPMCESNQFYDTPKSKCLICYDSSRDTCLVCESISECKTCKEGYQLDGVKVCQACPKNCKTCAGDVSKCEACKNGFFLNLDKTSCFPCTANCKTCTNSSTCTQCFDGYLSTLGDKCTERRTGSCPVFSKETSKNCSCLKLGTYLDSKTNTCKSCKDKFQNSCYICNENTCLDNSLSYCGPGNQMRDGICPYDSKPMYQLQTMFVFLVMAAIIIPMVIVLGTLSIIVGIWIYCCSSAYKPKK